MIDPEKYNVLMAKLPEYELLLDALLEKANRELKKQTDEEGRRKVRVLFANTAVDLLEVLEMEVADAKEELLDELSGLGVAKGRG